MSFNKNNIFKHLGLIIITLFLAETRVFAFHADSSAVVFRKHFVENIQKAENFCIAFNQNTSGIETLNKPEADPEGFYSSLNLTVFKTYSVTANDYLQILNGLPQTQKQNLISLFDCYSETVENELKKNGLPIELKYLAPALSGLNFESVDSQKRAGIWQLTHFQAVLNGLQITQLVDERINPLLEIRAFVAEMKRNFANYPTPGMAVLAFYFGNVKMKNAMENAGDAADLNTILFSLPASAGELIASFQSCAVFFSENKTVTPNNYPLKRNLPDTVLVNRQLHFKQVASVLAISQGQLLALNPQFRFQIVPGNEREQKLLLPQGKKYEFLRVQDTIYHQYDSSLFALIIPKIEYPPAPGRQYGGEPVNKLDIEGKTKIKYTLKTGDVLGAVAEEFDVSIEDLMYWNNIRNERKIQAGKSIVIFVDNERAADYQKIKNSDTAVNQVKSTSPVKGVQGNREPAVYNEINKGKKIEHVVKNGESPFVIAKKYPGVKPEDILLWNNISDERKIQIGQTLVIYLKD